MDFSLPANAPLLLAFAKLPDPRKERNRLYPLIDIVAVVLMGIICGANDVMSAYLWAQHRKDWFVSMGLCLGLGSGLAFWRIRVRLGILVFLAEVYYPLTHN